LVVGLIIAEFEELLIFRGDYVRAFRRYIPPHSNSLPPGEREKEIILSRQWRKDQFSLSWGRKGGQASSEDLLPLGYGEWDRIKVRVDLSRGAVPLQDSPQIWGFLLCQSVACS